MREKDGVKGKHVAMHRDKVGKSLVLLGRKSAIRLNSIHSSIVYHSTSTSKDPFRAFHDLFQLQLLQSGSGLLPQVLVDKPNATLLPVVGSSSST